MSDQLSLLDAPRSLWIEKHPRAWTFMLAESCRLVAAGRHFSPRLLFELARYHSPEWAADESYACNNNELRDLAERLRQEVPGMAELTETRDGAYVRRVEA